MEAQVAQQPGRNGWRASMTAEGKEAMRMGSRGEDGHGLAGVYPTRRPGVRARAVDGEMLLLNRQRQLVHQLNPTARYIWERCDGRHTVMNIVDELGQAFDIDAETVTSDVAAAVRQLETAGLVDMRSEQRPRET
jgi:hypothetical protein